MTVTASYESILEAIHYDQLSPSDQEAFLLDLNSLIYRGAVLRTVELMDEPTRAAWHDLVMSDAPEEKMRAFLERRVPGADLALADTVESLADDILAIQH
jgi:hypothetical protein